MNAYAIAQLVLIGFLSGVICAVAVKDDEPGYLVLLIFSLLMGLLTFGNAGVLVL